MNAPGPGLGVKGNASGFFGVGVFELIWMVLDMGIWEMYISTCQQNYKRNNVYTCMTKHCPYRKKNTMEFEFFSFESDSMSYSCMFSFEIYYDILDFSPLQSFHRFVGNGKGENSYPFFS